MSRRPRALFETIRSEGGLLPPELLKRIAAGDGELPGLAATDYHLEPGARLGEAVTRSWNRLLGAWASFREARAKLGDGAPDAGMTRERWLLPLFQELGYGRLLAARGGIEIEGRTVPVSHRWHHTPIHLIGFRTDLDRRSAGVAGAASPPAQPEGAQRAAGERRSSGRQSPHSLVQELLNRSDEHLWAVLSNGLRLRLLRDNASLTRQAYVEFDLEAMMEGEAYADFAVLWLVLHQSRVEAERPAECWLERWAQAAQQQGTRALEKLRGGVEAAIQAFGQGFLAHPKNAALRDALASGALGKQDYYRELLRLVYRLLFLFVAEDRHLLLDPDAKPDAQQRYLAHYGTARLRRLAARRRGGPHPDGWHALRLVMARLGDDRGCPELALPALGSYLWSQAALPHLADAELANEALLSAVRALAYTEEGRLLRAVDWRNLDSEELGSVYESLLELHPDVEAGAARFELASAAGSERKTTGSYYTPDSLVQCLLETALDPVLDEVCRKPDPEAALLALSVCDPACGSGHFLIAAARRIARRLAQVRTGDPEPDPQALRHALRDVIGKCLYGVDLNPMAVELCKVSLWLEALEPGRPLSYLDHQIQCGNSLLGTTPGLLAAGLPDAAFEPIEGDDKQIASALKRRNRAERQEDAQQQTMFGAFVRDAGGDYGTLASQAASLRELDDGDIAALRRKEQAFAALVGSETVRHGRLLADAWCAAFVWPKQKGAPDAPTAEVLRRLGEGAEKVPAATRAEIGRLAGPYRFFHWHLAFPEVFGAATGRAGEGGFDVVLSNPPWDQIQLDAREFFASRAPDIANAPHMSARNRAIAELSSSDPALHSEYVEAIRLIEGTQHFVHKSGRFPLTSYGRLNSAPLFAELSRTLVSDKGRAGLIVPSGIATDSFNQFFFQDLSERGSLASLYDFENARPIFPGVHRSYKFSLVTLSGSARPVREGAELAFFLHDPIDLADDERRFRLSAADIALLNPNTRTCPIFRSRRDAELTKWVYRRVPVLVREGPPEENPWGFKGLLMFMMNTASHLFRTRGQLEQDGWTLAGNVFEKSGERMLPLYEAKMIHHFDHRWATYDGDATRDLTSAEKTDPRFVPLPRYWVPEPEVEQRLSARWPHSWLLGWRDICRSTDERTVLASVVPRVGVGNNLPISLLTRQPDAVAGLVACISSFSLDYASRFKVGGTHLNFFITHQLPVLPPDAYATPAPWQSDTALLDWLRPRVLELTYTAWDLAPFAKDLGYDGPPFRWDEARRFQLRCELDAAFLHLYLGPTDEWKTNAPPELLAAFPTPRAAAAHILDSFPIVQRKDEQTHGEYRTKRVILETYDALDEAARSGRSYQTPIEPPPADLRTAYGGAAALRIAAQSPPPRRLVRVSGEARQRYVDRVPLLHIDAAAGPLHAVDEPGFDDWIQITPAPPLRKGMFLVRANGDSMEPRIPNGAYCLFQRTAPADFFGSIVLVELRETVDPEAGGRYLIKRVERGREGTVELHSENPSYPPVPVAANEAEIRVVARLVDVIAGPHALRSSDGADS